MFRKQWFLLVLMVVLATGITFAPFLAPLAELKLLKWAIVSVTMFLIVWPFSFEAVTETLRNPRAAFLAIAFNGIVMPLAVWPLSDRCWNGGDVCCTLYRCFSCDLDQSRRRR